jgi:hypothetical protein
MSANTLQARRGDWGERAPTEREQGPREDRPGGSGEGKAWGQRLAGINNRETGRGRESDRPIVAVMRSNVRGAKGPSFSHVSNKERRSA